MQAGAAEYAIICGMRFFAYPEMLLFMALLPVAAFAWAFMRARREKALGRISLSVPPSGAGGVQLALVALGLALVFFAAARPRWGRTTQKTVSRSRNIVVAIDVSRSMLAEDLRPNRLGRVKADVADLIDSLGPDRCGLVAFRHNGVAVSPLTTDHSFLRSALESLSPDSAAKGETDIGSAIRECLNVLDSDAAEDDDRPAADGSHNAIILISDGGDLKGDALKMAELAKRRRVPIFTVGIGDPVKGAPIPAENGKGYQTYKGSQVMVKLEEATLRKIAEASGARYVPLATLSTAETTLGSIYRNYLREVAAAELNEEESSLAERYQFFLVPGLAMLLAAAALSRGRPAARSTPGK